MTALRAEVYEAGREYAAALAEACATQKIDPLRVLLDTDRYPKIVKELEMVEFLVGWFHGVEDATGLSLREIWSHLSAGEGKGRESTGSKPNTSPQKQIAKAKDFTMPVDRVVVALPPAPPPPPKSKPRARRKAKASAQTGLPL